MEINATHLIRIKHCFFSRVIFLSTVPFLWNIVQGSSNTKLRHAPMSLHCRQHNSASLSQRGIYQRIHMNGCLEEKEGRMQRKLHSNSLKQICINNNSSEKEIWSACKPFDYSAKTNSWIKPCIYTRTHKINQFKTTLCLKRCLFYFLFDLSR